VNLSRYALGLGGRPDRLVIDISFAKWQKIVAKRDEALRKRFLISSPDDYVPAKIRCNGRTVRVKLRLKGDGPDHWCGNKWSFRIKVRGEETLFGMRKFSIHDPVTRCDLHEWVFKEAVRSEGLICMKYDFVDVTVNGEHKGLYAIEEYPQKEMLERNGRRESVIVKFNDDLLFRELTANPTRRMELHDSIRAFHASNVDAIDTNKVLRAPGAARQFDVAVSLLGAFRSQKLKASEVFDIEKLAALYALSDLFGALHGTNWGNVRFYYDPIVSKLEPVPYDAMAGSKLEFLHCDFPPFMWQLYHYNGDDSQFMRLLFADEEFMASYLHHLERVSRPNYLKSFLTQIHSELEARLDLFYAEDSDHRFDADIYSANAAFIRHLLRPVKACHAFLLERNDQRLLVNLGNVQTLPVEIVAAVAGDVRLPPRERVVMQGWRCATPVTYRQLLFDVPEQLSWQPALASQLRIQYRVLGTSVVAEEQVFPWPNVNWDLLEERAARQKAAPKQFEWLTVDDSRRRIAIERGEWTISEDVVFPPGYTVVCGAGTKLSLVRSAKIVSYCPVEFRGDEGAPVVVTSEDHSGQGVTVLCARSRSALEHVVFQGLRSPAEKGWELTGAVTFYRSDVDIDRCRFVGSDAEDALNIVRSEFTVSDSLFESCRSDALDIDYGHGSVVRSSFVESGSDGIDLCGSAARMESIAIRGAGDKGISVGENSPAETRDVFVQHASVAVAVKDLSSFTLSKAEIADTKVGIALYQKKPEFGPATATVTGVEVSGSERPFLVENGSSLTIDGATFAPNHAAVLEFLYGKQ